MRSEGSKALVRHKKVEKVGGKTLSHVSQSQRTDGSWYWEIRHPLTPDGKRPYERVCDVKEQGAAIRVQARWAEIHGGGKESGSRNPNETLEQAVEIWKADCLADLATRSVDAYRQALGRIERSPLWKKRVREIEWTDIKRWLDGLTNDRKGHEGEPLADSTKRNTLAVLDVVLAYAVERKVLPVAPKIPRGKKPKIASGRDRVLTPAEDDLLGASFGQRKWMEAVYDVTLGQALRMGEVLGLRWEDVDFENRTLRVERQIHKDGTVSEPKDGSSGVIELSERAERTLLGLREQVKAEGKLPVGWVFVNTLGEHRRHKDIDRAFRQAVRASGIEPICFHGLRHTMISRLFMAGVAPTAIQHFARHALLATTMHYAHNIPNEDMSDRIRKAA